MNDLLALLGLIAGGLVAVGVIWKAGLVPIYRIVRKIEKAHDLILEFPEWQEKVNHSLSQLHPNGGSSIKDVVNTTKTDVSELRQLVVDHLNSPEPHGVRINIEGQG